MRRKKLSTHTSYDEILFRLNEVKLEKTDLRFLASHMRDFRGDVRYVVLKAKIQSLVSTILRSPKKSEDSAYNLGRIEGLDYIFKLIDDMCVYDVNIKKEEEAEAEEVINPDQIVHNDSTGI